jgi:type II secretory pathway component PulF
MLIITRAQQYRKFWQDLYHLLSAGMHLRDALGQIADKIAGSPDKFDRSIIQMAKAFKKKNTSLYEAMRESGAFSEVERSNIFYSEAKVSIGALSCDQWQQAIHPLIHADLATMANQYARFYCTFGTLLNSRVPTLPAIKISAHGLDGPLVPAVALITELIKEGGRIGDGMRMSKAFTKYEYSLMTAGDERLESAITLLGLASDCRL